MLVVGVFAAAQPTPFFIPELGESVDSVKAKIIAPSQALIADCNRIISEQQTLVAQKNKQQRQRFAALQSDFDTRCKKALASSPRITGTRALGSIEFETERLYDTETIYFRNGVVDGFSTLLTFGLGMLDETFADYSASATKKYGAPAQAHTTTYQNGFGATFTGCRAVWKLADGGTLLIDAKPQSDGTSELFIQLESKERAASSKSIAADPFAK